MIKVHYSSPLLDENGDLIYTDEYEETTVQQQIRHGEILHWGIKAVETPDGKFIPVTVCYVCDTENGDIVALMPEELQIDNS